MQFSSTAVALLGLLLAGWTFVSAWLALGALNRDRASRGARANARRLTRLLDESPAIPMIVRPDGRIEAPDRLAAWLGLDRLPVFLSELGGEVQGLPAEELESLREAVRRAQKTATPFSHLVHPRGSPRTLAVRGQMADPKLAATGAAA